MRTYDGYADQKVRENGTFLSQLQCSCGQPIATQDRMCPSCKCEVNVTLLGKYNELSQKCRWFVFMGEPKGEPIGLLSCGYCECEVTSLNRLCECGFFSSVCLRSSNEEVNPSSYPYPKHMWEVHRQVSPIDEIDSVGVIVREEITDTTRPHTPVKLDTSVLDLVLGQLYCPDDHRFTNNAQLDNDLCCREHHLRLSAILVKRQGVIYVERVAKGAFGTENIPYLRPDVRWVGMLCCPFCDNPIIDSQLKCQTCNIFVDVVLRPYQEQDIRGNYWTRVDIVVVPRAISDTVRPENALPIKIDDLSENDGLAIEGDVNPEVKVSAQEMDNLELRKKAKRLLKNNSYREVAKKLGVSLGRLQHVVKKKPSQLRKSNSSK